MQPPETSPSAEFADDGELDLSNRPHSARTRSRIGKGRMVLSAQPVTSALALAILVTFLARVEIPGLVVITADGAVLAIAVAVLLGYTVERRIGRAWTAVVFCAATVVAALIGGIAIQAVSYLGSFIGLGGLEPAQHLRDGITGTAPGMMGLLLAGTATMSSLWRRRIRLAVLTAGFAAVLYFGRRSGAEFLLGSLVGLALGELLWRGRGRAQAPLRSHGFTLRERRNLVAVVVVAATLGPVVVHLVPGANGLLSPLGNLVGVRVLTPAEVAQICGVDAAGQTCRDAAAQLRHTGVGPFILGMVPTIFALLCAGAMRRGRSAGWWGAVLVVAAWLLAVLWQGGVAVVPLAVILVMLLTQRRYFSLRVGRAVARQGAAQAALVVLVGLLGYLVGGTALGAGFATRPRLVSLLVDYPRRLIPPRFLGIADLQAAVGGGEDVFASTPLPVSATATALYEWIGIAVWCALGIVLWRVLHAGLRGTEGERGAVITRLLHEPGGASQSWMSTWTGNSYWVDDDGSAAVAYQSIGGVEISVGDPVAAPTERGAAALRFADSALARGFVPCLFNVEQATRDACVAAGWNSVQVAEETIIELPQLEFRGKKFQDVRTALNRARKEEITALWTTWEDAPLGIRDQIVAISEAWVSDKGLPEMGFTLGGVDELDDSEVRILLAVDGGGTVHGVTSWMPVYRDGVLIGLTLDFMRRRAEGFRPVMEFLIATAALDAKDKGLEFVSLSGAPLAHSRADGSSRNPGDASALDAILNQIGETLEPVYGFRSLLAFKAKFQPSYRPVYMCYEDPAALPKIGAAVARAYLGPTSPRMHWRLIAELRRARAQAGARR